MENMFYVRSRNYKSVKYFEYKIKLLKSELESKPRIDIFTIEDELDKILTELEEHLSNSKDNILYLYKCEIIDIVNEMNSEINWWKAQERPKEIERKLYVEKCTSKLNSMFRKQPLLSDDEITSKIGNYDYLYEKYNIFIELLEWINEQGIAVIPDRILFSAFLGINIDDYQRFLNYTDRNIQSIFRSIEEYIITSKMNAGEIGSRNNNAIKTNLSYEKVGNNLTPKDNPQNNTTNNVLITNNDILNRIRNLGYQAPKRNIGYDSEIIDND